MRWLDEDEVACEVLLVLDGDLDLSFLGRSFLDLSFFAVWATCVEVDNLANEIDSSLLNTAGVIDLRAGSAVKGSKDGLSAFCFSSHAE